MEWTNYQNNSPLLYPLSRYYIYYLYPNEHCSCSFGLKIVKTRPMHLSYILNENKNHSQKFNFLNTGVLIEMNSDSKWLKDNTRDPLLELKMKKIFQRQIKRIHNYFIYFITKMKILSDIFERAIKNILLFHMNSEQPESTGFEALEFSK